MNIEAFDTDTLRQLIRNLQNENQKLKEKLDKAQIPYETTDFFEQVNRKSDEYDLDQGGRIVHPGYITENTAKRFFSMFWGREDVYAKRGKKGGYFPQCANRWNDHLCPKQQNQKIFCDECINKKWTRLDVKKIINHLLGYKEDGSDVIGVYPLLPDGTCRFLVFDFDNHEKAAENIDFANQNDEWRDEVDALRKICEQNGISHLVERSRSGRGAHIWIFFKRAIKASKARNFGFMLLDKGAAAVNLKTFHYYDRMYPSQDIANGIGNLVALPMQGQALRDGNSVFIDRHWNAYPNQWDILLNKTRKLEEEEIDTYIDHWKKELLQDQIIFNNDMNDRPKPWKKKQKFSKMDVTGKLHIVLSNGIYVDTLNIMPRLQNQIRSMAAFDNPEFYKNSRMGYSNYYNHSVIYLGKDTNGYIQIPRGLRETLIEQCKTAGIEYDILDEREKGRPIRVKFKGTLKEEQNAAAEKLLQNTDGILNAATAFGKTVVCSYLIAKRKINTLILVQSKDLLIQWTEELNKFLEIDEKPPMYETKSGRKRQRKSVIGILHGNKNSLTGIIDVAMVGSMYSKGKFKKEINSYGMVIMDECHHAASNTAIKLLQKINAKYVYGVSATPKRGDHLDRILYMMLGPQRHKFSALDRAKQQGIGHYFIPRYTRMIETEESKHNINQAYQSISQNTVRNEMIVEDVKASIKSRKNPVILTKYKEQAKVLYEMLDDVADNIFLLYGDNTDRQNFEIRENLKRVKDEETMILVATGQKIGEGFDCPRLDTLMLAAPVSYDGRLEQYLGRLNRDYKGKEAVYVYDYIDSHIRYFDNMYIKRLRTYKRTGFTLWTENLHTKQNINAIYNSGNYTEKFEQDMIEADKSVVISSPDICQDKIERLLYLMKQRQEAGVKVRIIMRNPENIRYGNPEMLYELVAMMRLQGVEVYLKDEIEARFAVIDDELVWHGGVNLLGKEDVWDNLMRIRNVEVAAELLEIGFGGENYAI